MSTSFSKIKYRFQNTATPVLITGLILSAAVLGAVMGQSTTIATIIVAATICVEMFVVSLKNPLWMLITLLGLAFSADYLQFVFRLPYIVSLLPDLAIATLFIIALVTQKFGVKQPTMKGFLFALVLLLLAILFSAIANATPLTIAIAGLKNYVLYPILFITVVALDISEKDRRIILGLLLGLILIQSPIAILQRYDWVPGAGAAQSGFEDLAGGTLGANATGTLSVLSIGIIGIMLNLIVLDRFRWRYLVAACVAALGPIASEGKVIFLLLPAAMVFVLGTKIYFKPREKWRQLGSVIVISLALLALTWYLMSTLGLSTTVTRVFSSPEELWTYLIRAGGDPQFARFGRLTDLEVTLELILGNLTSSLLGFGVGWFSSAAQSFSSPGTFGTYLSKGIGGVQASAILLETGIAGAGAYMLLLVQLCAGLLRTMRNWKGPQLLYASSFIVAWGIYLASLFYTQPWWSSGLSVSFWIFAATTWISTRENKQHDAGQ